MSQRVLITGAASGLGKALALNYAKLGADVCVADINAEAGEQVVAQIQADGGKAFFQPCNITQEADIEQLLQALQSRWQGLDVLVNNAGVATAGALEFEDIEQWQWVLDINLLGLVRMTRSLAGMLKQAGNQDSPATIINIASQAGITPIPIMGSYNASKAAVVSFSETMHLELAKDNIHVSVACPSFFETNLDKSLRSKQPGVAKLVKKMLTRSDINAEQVAQIIVQQSQARQFMIVTHKAGRAAYRLKRWLPIGRYLNMVKQQTRKLGQISD